MSIQHCASDDSGAKRSWTEAFIVHELRGKGTITRKVNTKESEHTDSKGTNKRWWGKERMIKKLGQHKAEKWIESGKLQSRADPITELFGEWDLEYHCPEDYESTIDTDKNNHKMQVVGEAFSSNRPTMD